MLQLTKLESYNDYDRFSIKTNEGEFNISFENNLDLYWSYFSEESMLDCEDIKKFTITKEDLFIYSAFLDLYNALKSRKPYLNISWDNDKKFKNKKDIYSYCPYEKGIIEWKSDDYLYDEAASVSIIKEKDSFKVIFKKGKNEFFKTFSVRFRNSGSRYNPYNATFMSMYHKLQEYDFDSEKNNKEGITKVLKK